MLRVDEAIFDTNKVICKNISRFDASERGLLSQNILSQLRNFIEYIVQKVYSNGADTDPNDYTDKKTAWEYIKTRGELRFLSNFHNLLQKSVSHYTFDEGGSERLMLKYYEYLIRIKSFLNDRYGMVILENIDDFPINLDTNLMEYYTQIANRIVAPTQYASQNPYNDRAYIQKIKPFFVQHRIYYEVTFTVANDRASKFDRIIAFTRYDITDNYAVKLSLHNDFILVLGKTMPIQVIDGWSVSIRPCEMNRFADFFGDHKEISGGGTEYRNLMRYLTDTRSNLVDIVTSSEYYYQYAKTYCSKGAKVTHFFGALDKAREIVINQNPGSNVIRYLLYKMNNKIMKRQYSEDSCTGLSNLCFQWGCIPFDRMPFATSLIEHNPRIYDLLDSISSSNRMHEFLARQIRNNTEQKDVLFTPVDELQWYDNLDNQITQFNSKVYYKHSDRYIRRYKDYVYIQGYVDDTAEIIRKLKQLSATGIAGYTAFVDSWLSSNPSYNIDSEEKLCALRSMFSDSQVAMIYGSAGTGKSTLINHVSNLYSTREKLYLANTNPAVDNLRRKVTASNCEFKTIARFLSKNNTKTNYDIMFIDECSTVNNKDMRKILERASFKLLILVGDVFQIESILFGNWFSIARKFIPKTSVSELSMPYRSSNKGLLTIWDRVRKLDDAILEPLVKEKHTVNLDESIFEHSEDDEIILCLNYDGLYGINNINRFLQCNNPSPAIDWGVNVYKVGDPILFNETERFAPLIYNNMKGRLLAIEPNVLRSRIRFEVELDTAFSEWEAECYDFELIGLSEAGNSIISFWVNAAESTDTDDASSNSIVPFQVAYAVSIHKAQGLEYQSVKIVITNEVEEQITHNIFYTAITRAKEKLKIYWTPETEKKVLDNLKLKDFQRDAAILSAIERI